MDENLGRVFGDKVQPVANPEQGSPRLWATSDYSQWNIFSHNEKNGKNDDYFNSMALAYACATKKLDVIQLLLERMDVAVDGYFGMVNAPLFAAIDYNSIPDDQYDVVRLLRKHGAQLYPWKLDKHRPAMSSKLWEFMDPINSGRSGPEDFDLVGIPNYLETSPLSQMSEEELRRHMDVLALSYALLSKKPVEATFLLSVRKVPAQGVGHFIGEPLNAVLRKADTRMMAVAKAYGILPLDGDDPQVPQPA